MTIVNILRSPTACRYAWKAKSNSAPRELKCARRRYLPIDARQLSSQRREEASPAAQFHGQRASRQAQGGTGEQAARAKASCAADFVEFGVDFREAWRAKKPPTTYNRATPRQTGRFSWRLTPCGRPMCNGLQIREPAEPSGRPWAEKNMCKIAHSQEVRGAAALSGY